MNVHASKKTNRAEALADGTFAIVMTLLVIELHAPEARHFGEIIPHLWAYGLSFALLGTYWIAHYNLFHWVRGVNHALLWMNIWFLSLVSLVPFSTNFLITNNASTLAIRWYATHALAILASLFAMSRYVRSRELLEDESNGHIERVLGMMAVPATVALLTILLA